MDNKIDPKLLRKGSIVRLYSPELPTPFYLKDLLTGLSGRQVILDDERFCLSNCVGEPMCYYYLKNVFKLQEAMAVRNDGLWIIKGEIFFDPAHNQFIIRNEAKLKEIIYTANFVHEFQNFYRLIHGKDVPMKDQKKEERELCWLSNGGYLPKQFPIPVPSDFQFPPIFSAWKEIQGMAERARKNQTREYGLKQVDSINKKIEALNDEVATLTKELKAL